MSHSIWKPSITLNSKAINKISKELSLSPITSKILVNRGIDTVEKVNKFFNDDFDSLNDPYLFDQMGIAVKRILKAHDETIMVFGDYDVDGVSATTILTKALRSKGYTVIPKLGSRNVGYGIKPEHIVEAKRQDVKLIITVDLGVACFPAAEKAKELGIDMIVTDHHIPKGKKVNVLAIINPHCDNYPYKGLCGTGVAFKLIQALSKEFSGLDAKEYLEFVAFATIADVVPLTGENRIITKLGLDKLSRTKHIGLKAFLMANSLYEKKMTSDIVGFILGPRINAAGRMESPDIALEMFLIDKEQDFDRAINIAKELTSLNNERKKVEHQIRDEALQQIQDKGYEKDPTIVLASETWQKSVVGIVASVISNMFYRPCILLSIEGNKATGSGRNRAPKLGLLEALNKCEATLLEFGGHAAAAGLSLLTDKVDDFRNQMNKVASKVLKPEDLVPVIEYEDVIDIRKLNYELYDELIRLQPYGQGNPSPLFLVEDILVPRAETTKDGEHLRLTIMKEKLMKSGVGFWMGHHKKELFKDPTQRYDLLFEFDRNVYDGEEFLQMSLRDIKPVELLW